jgi:hypothetical protein
MAHDVFISYPSKDKTIADAVCSKLEGQNIRCWIAPRDVHAGQNFAESIIKAIDTCKVFVLIWSASTNASEHILNEINRAFDKGITIIPFRIQDVQPTDAMSYYFGRTHWLDALTPPLEKHIETLIDRIYIILGRKRIIIPVAPITREGETGALLSQEEKSETVVSQKKVSMALIISALVVIAAVSGFFSGKPRAVFSTFFRCSQTGKLNTTSILGQIGRISTNH